jgi:hypothetical protein
VEVAVTLYETGMITFTSAGRTTVDNITYTKVYSENTTGELVTFQNISGDVKEKFVNVTNILPIATVEYSPS